MHAGNSTMSTDYVAHSREQQGRVSFAGLLVV